MGQAVFANRLSSKVAAIDNAAKPAITHKAWGVTSSTHAVIKLGWPVIRSVIQPMAAIPAIVAAGIRNTL